MTGENVIARSRRRRGNLFCINVRLLRCVRNDPCLIVRLLRAKALAMTVNGHCQWSSSPFLSLRGAVGDAAIMSLRGGEVPAATSFTSM